MVVKEGEKRWKIVKKGEKEWKKVKDVKDGENERSERGHLKSGGVKKRNGEGYKCLNFKIFAVLKANNLILFG